MDSLTIRAVTSLTRSAPLDITRDLLIRGTELAKQQPQRVTGSHRPWGHTKQIEEEHPAGKARPQHMGGPDGERGFPHAPRACDEAHHAGPLRTLGIRQIAHPGQRRGAAGEVVNQPWQLTHTSRTCPVIPQPAITRQLNKLLASIPLKHKRIRQSGYGPVPRPLAPSALHIRQSPGAHHRHFSELL